MLLAAASSTRILTQGEGLGAASLDQNRYVTRKSSPKPLIVEGFSDTRLRQTKCLGIELFKVQSTNHLCELLISVYLGIDIR